MQISKIKSDEISILEQNIVRFQNERQLLEKENEKLRYHLKQIFESQSWRYIQLVQKIRLFFLLLESIQEKFFKV